MASSWNMSIFCGTSCTLNFIVEVSLSIGVLSSMAQPAGGPLSFSYTRPELDSLGTFRAATDEATATAAEKALRRSIVSGVYKTRLRRRGGEKRGEVPTTIYPYPPRDTIDREPPPYNNLNGKLISPSAWIEMLESRCGYLPS